MRFWLTTALFLLPLGCLAPSVGHDAALLRLDYLEFSHTLPALRLTSVEILDTDRYGSSSPVLWRVHDEAVGSRDFFRPLPVRNIEQKLWLQLNRTLESHGFSVLGKGSPLVDVTVKVRRLILKTENGSVDRRSCRMELAFVLSDADTGLSLGRFSGRGEQSFPGSWTLLRGADPEWIPLPDQPDPVLLAAREATRDFLAGSRDFWLNLPSAIDLSLGDADP